MGARLKASVGPPLSAQRIMIDPHHGDFCGDVDKCEDENDGNDDNCDDNYDRDLKLRGPSGPQLLGFGPFGLLDFVLRAFGTTQR